ncbi:PREDICTED: polycystic kidney disease protein 1-like 3 [Dipodomys ordii]|uniref:Polycystic kidney disease protein 1-like 3 n=1 Tax=Dipodomys ordii TaxID=10020 RepID=A0A1S3EUN4_DIPOR|nr:PREDICTED: polycystic kidney disease protein 1-like 3 [Dipodomys ordii]
MMQLLVEHFQVQDLMSSGQPVSCCGSKNHTEGTIYYVCTQQPAVVYRDRAPQAGRHDTCHSPSGRHGYEPRRGLPAGCQHGSPTGVTSQHIQSVQDRFLQSQQKPEQDESVSVLYSLFLVVGTQSLKDTVFCPPVHLVSTYSQVSSELAKHLSPTRRELKKACETLQNLRDLAPSFQSPAQVPVVNLLIDLTEQILRIPSQNRGTRGSETPATLCHFPPPSVMNGEVEKLQTPKQDTNQVEDMLEMALLALGTIQDAFLQQNPGCQSSVTLTSAAASVLLSSQNISTLPLSSYTLGGPAPVSLGLPSSSALEAFLNKYPRVKVQVTGLAFNPFQTFDGRNITGSVGSVLLSSGQEQLHVHDLMEDVEIVLWRNANIDTHASSLNTSTARFTASVNVTSVERSLLVAIEPASPLFLTLYLGFQYPPNHTCFLLTTTLPKSTTGQKDEDYTWVLTPDSLQYRTGTYYITAILNETETAWQTPILVSVVTAVTQCYFWDKNNRTWKSSGCQVGLRSTVVKTQCLCDHLTFFGSDFFIVPRTVRVEDTVTLFRHVSNNPVGVSLLASLLGLYMFLAVWAWRKDQRDMQKVKVTVLADNEPGSRFHYLVEVRTGLRPRAACTAQVVATLYGSEGHSRPRHLWDPQTTAFGRGALDVFLLGTRAPLGELHALRLWLHGSPRRCSWYISQVIVSDMATKKKWHFLCDCWLAKDLGDFQCDRVFTPASRTELLSFRHLFSSTIVERFTQDHLWLSIATRHPWNQFTRLQRLTCCTTLLLCDMVINVMFWRMEGPTAKRVEPMGPFAVTWLEVLISIQTAVILLPAHLVIRQLFLWIQPREALPLLPPLPAACPPGAAWEPSSSAEVVEELKETVGFLLRRDTRLLADCEPPVQTPHDMSQLVMLLSRIIHSHLEEQGYCRHSEPQGPSVASETQYHFHWYLHRVLRRLEAHLDTLATTQGHQPCDLREAASQLQKLQELLETRVLPMEKGAARETTSFPMLSPEAGKRPRCVFPPALLTSICWLLLGVTSLASAFFTALYSLDLSKDQATSWAVSMMLSALQDTFISQPVKVIVFTFLLSLLASRMPWLNKEKEQQTNRILALWAKCSSSLSGSRDKNNPIYKPPVVTRPTNDPKRTWKKKKLLKLTGDMLSKEQWGCWLKQQKWRFFTRKRNVLDLSIVVISFSILGLDMKRISLHKKNMAQYRRDPERFISFYEAVNVSCAVTHLVGFLVLLATVQLWNLLLHNPRLKVISNTLSKAWDEVVGFLLVILILLSSYAITFNLLFGWSIADYQTFFSSAVTVVGLLMGISHHEEVIDLHPVLGSFLILSNVILMVFVIINLFVSAILIAFGKERKSLQKEAALAGMLLQKLSNLLGIPQLRKSHDNGY